MGVCQDFYPEKFFITSVGNAGHGSSSKTESSGSSGKSSKLSSISNTNNDRNNFYHDNNVNGARDSTHYYENCLWLGPSRDGGWNF